MKKKYAKNRSDDQFFRVNFFLKFENQKSAKNVLCRRPRRI